MRPTLTTHDSMALLTADAVECAKFDKGYAAFCVALANGLYVGFGKLGLNMIFASLINKTVARMQNVLPMSYPFKVAYMVVGRVVVNMVDLVSSGRVAKESKCNKAMNQSSSFARCSVELDGAMAVLPPVWRKNFATTNTKNVSMIGNLVKIFKARNWLPNFGHIQPLLVDSSVEVAWQLAQKPAFGSYPSQAGEF